MTLPPQLLASDLDDLPGNIVGLFVIVLLTLLGWLKDKFFAKPDADTGPEVSEEEREIIWRRQTESLPPPMPWQVPQQPRVVVTGRRPAPVPVAPPALPKVRELSAEEMELARAFEIRDRRSRRTHHRRRLDGLLRSPHAARQAILLREILGEPVALKSGSAETLHS
jgi:hypothetical protein